jgi:hypothetical protein
MVLNDIKLKLCGSRDFSVKLCVIKNKIVTKLKLIILLTYLSSSILSQEVRLSERIITIAEELAADESDPYAAELFSEWLFELTEDPVMINTGDEREISRLFFLNDFQIKVLADYVRKTGRIISPFEIANIPGFDRESVEMLIPFISLNNIHSTFSDSLHFRQSLLSNFIYKTTIPEVVLPGSPWKILTRYKFLAGGFTGGFTAEKDPGEKLISGKIPMPDFYAGYLAFQGRNIVKSIVLGDYSVRFGMGTNINTGIRRGLSLTTQGNLSGRSEIKPYTSTDENNFFRGVSTELSVRNINLILFLSANTIDATLNDRVDSVNFSVKSLYKTGLHTDAGTILKKDALRETVFGANLSYNFKNLRTGLAWTETKFSLPVSPDKNNPADRYDFAGHRSSVYTLYYNSLIKRFVLYGEFSASGTNGYAFVQGVSLRPADRLSINLLYRNYSPDYISLHTNGPSGSSTGNNEYGILGNFTFEAARFLFISAGSEVTDYQWLRYRCSSPSGARRHELRIRYLPSQKITIEALYNSRTVTVDSETNNGIHRQDEIVTQYVRGAVKYSPSDYLTFVTRADYKIVNLTKSKGMLLLQDLQIRLRGFPVTIWMRYGIYNTGGYDSGIYTWENDLLNSFSIPVMYGSGNRRYIMASWKIKERAELRIKYGVTSTSVINGRMKDINEIRIQFRIMI